MNLFVTDDCPHQAAKNLPDKLVVKMALENAQMLAANFSDEFLGFGSLPKKDGTPYKATHKNHPCTKWGRESLENAAWMIAHGVSICAEYTRRYDKLHSCVTAHTTALTLFMDNGGVFEDYRDHTPFVRAMPDEFKLDTTISTVEAYRRYMHTKHYAKWKHGNEPEWWNPEEHQGLQRSV
jgi:hypothetical protein